MGNYMTWCPLQVIQTADRLSVQVDMYPFKVTYYKCMDSTGLPSVQDAPRVMWVSKRADLRTLQTKVKTSYDYNEYRFWLRLPTSPGKSYLLLVSFLNIKHSRKGKIYIFAVVEESNFGDGFRDITVVFQCYDTKDGWFLLDMADTTPIADIVSGLIGDAAELEILVEKRLYQSSPWPRAKVTTFWMNQLKANDILDYKGSWEWVEAVVVSADPNNLVVRPLGNMSTIIFPALKVLVIYLYLSRNDWSERCMRCSSHRRMPCTLTPEDEELARQ